MTLSITTLCIKCHYAECHSLIIVMLNVIKLSVAILKILMLSAMEPLKIQKTVDETKQLYFCNLL